MKEIIKSSHWVSGSGYDYTDNVLNECDISTDIATITPSDYSDFFEGTIYTTEESEGRFDEYEEITVEFVEDDTVVHSIKFVVVYE